VLRPSAAPGHYPLPLALFLDAPHGALFGADTGLLRVARRAPRATPLPPAELLLLFYRRDTPMPLQIRQLQVRRCTFSRRAGLHIPDALRSEYVNVTEAHQLQVQRSKYSRRAGFHMPDALW